MHKVCDGCRTEQPLTEFQKVGDYIRNKCRTCRNEYKRQRNYKERYGIEYNTYLEMYQEAKGSCKICRKNFPTLCVDHDHKTGKVRGLLCHHCNTMLGLALDDVSTLTNAINYIESSRDQGCSDEHPDR